MSSIVVDRMSKKDKCSGVGKRQRPCTGKKLCFSLLDSGKMFGVTLLVLLYTTGRIDKLLLAGKERMAGRADLDLHLVHNRAHLNS